MPEKTLGATLRLSQKQLEEVKSKYEDRDYDIARYVNPRRELLKDSQRFDDRGYARGKQSYSGVPNSALSVWVDGMQGHMVSSSLNWFRAVMDNAELNENDEVQMWLQKYTTAMYGVFEDSNFYSILGEWFRDAGSIGTATLFTEEDIGKGVAVHIPIHPREIFIAEDKYGNVDTVHRKFFLTARQAADKFDEEKLSKSVIENAKNHPQKMHEFIHAVFPNTDRQYESLLSINKPWASVYLETNKDRDTKEDGVVQRSGFDLNPYAVWRLRKNSDEIYGYSAAADAMVEIKKAHQMSRTLLEAGHMAVRPPLNIPEHMRGNTEIRPDGHNYYEKGGDKASVINTGINYPIAIDREEKTQRIIEDAYRVEFFLILARAEREMTATEIMERQAEKSVLLGPQVDRLEREGLAKVFDIVSDIADKNDKLPEPPQIVQDFGNEIKIKFTGPLAQAQRRLFQMQPIKNGLNELAMASTVFPKVLERVNQDRLAERILDATDFPQDVMNTDAEMKAIRDQQEAELQQAQAQAQAQAMADSIPKLQKKTEEGSPLEAIGAELGV